jgi:hypothetical protein
MQQAECIVSLPLAEHIGGIRGLSFHPASSEVIFFHHQV